jgi:hypothetical protein
MKKLFLIACLLTISCSQFAQQCSDAVLDTLHGKWKTLIPGSIPYTITKTNIQKERLTMQGVIEILRRSFPDKPVSGDIGYGTFWEGDDHRPTPIIKICDSYYTYINYMQFHCYDGKVNGDNQYGDASAFHSFFNELPFRFDYSFYTPGPKAPDQGIDPLTDVYAIIRSLPIVKEGYFDYIKGDGDGSGNSTGNVSRYRTITKPGKLPYVIMSKKEYYEKWKHKYNIQIENIEADKERIRKELAGNPYLAEAQKSNDQYKTIYQNYINKIDNILKSKSAESLSEPAFEGEDQGEYFESRQADGYLRSYIVRPNFAYYNNTLNDKAAPQLITLRFNYYQDADALGNKRYNCAKFHRALEQISVFDLMFEKLKILIVP